MQELQTYSKFGSQTISEEILQNFIAECNEIKEKTTKTEQYIAELNKKKADEWREEIMRVYKT